MSAKDSSNTHDVISTLFRAMNTEREERAAAKIPRWADDVNGGLFSGSMGVPRFSKIARSYLVHEAESVSEATASAAIDLSGSVKEFVDSHVRHIGN
jgi:hypothetical protein